MTYKLIRYKLYYKKILDKRLEAYKFIETQIAVLKNSVLDTDARAYYSIFSYGRQQFYDFQNNLHVAIAYGMWMNCETSRLMDDLNGLFFEISNELEMSDEKDMVEIGKLYYDKIGTLRRELEDSVRNDLMKLHNFRELRKKSRSSNVRQMKVPRKNNGKDSLQ